MADEMIVKELDQVVVRFSGDLCDGSFCRDDEL